MVLPDGEEKEEEEVIDAALACCSACCKLIFGPVNQNRAETNQYNQANAMIPTNAMGE